MKSIYEIVSKFKNGNERFNKSAITNSIIQQLSRGSDPICLIDTRCDMIDEQTLLMERLIINQGVPSILIKKEKCTCSKCGEHIKPELFTFGVDNICGECGYL